MADGRLVSMGNCTVVVTGEVSQGSSKVVTLTRISGPWPEKRALLEKVAGSRIYCGAWWAIEPQEDRLTCSMVMGSCD